MPIPLKQILERVEQRLTSREPEGWPCPEEDAMNLTFLVRRLITQVHRMNRDIERAQRPRKLRIALPPPQDLCPLCAGYTWDRPWLPDGAPGKYQGDRTDYTKRRCKYCGEVRPEPPEEG